MTCAISSLLRGSVIGHICPHRLMAGLRCRQNSSAFSEAISYLISSDGSANKPSFAARPPRRISRLVGQFWRPRMDLGLPTLRISALALKVTGALKVTEAPSGGSVCAPVRRPPVAEPPRACEESSARPSGA
jgi:hypothetical protein